MRRYLPVCVLILGLVLVGCNGNTSTANNTANSVNTTATPAPGTVMVGATSAIPTATPLPQNGGTFPVNTLIITQANVALAQLPNRQTVALTPDRQGDKGSPNGRYGVQIAASSKLSLIDYNASTTGTAVDIPQSDGFTTAIVAWKAASDGFAFTGIPPFSNPKFGGIYYYDIVGKTTTTLVAPPADTKTAATPRAFSPDGKLLLFAVGSTNSESIGGPDSQFYYIDVTNHQQVPLPSATTGFNQWTKNSRGFIVAQHDPTGKGSVVVYMLDALTTPTVITPSDASDRYIDLSLDGKFVTVTSTPAGQKAAIPEIYFMKLDGSSRKVLTNFTAIDTSITALVWGNDGIYYSLHTADKTNPDTIWRMGLDGSNPTQVGLGTLNTIIGTR